jgi:hemerythrin-like domain-containing protein
LPPILEAMSRMSAIETLVEEHRLISRMVNVLPVLNKHLEHGDPEGVNVLIDVVDFFRMYVDKNHHAKEEYALFPILERRAVNPEGCTIQSLMSEHEQARILTTTLADAIAKYKIGDSKVKVSICAALRNSIDLYNDQIWRENILLFTVAEKTLQKSELNDITTSYSEVEKRLGTDFRAKYEHLVDALENKFPS